MRISLPNSKQIQWGAYLFLLPNLMGFLFFIFVPVLASFALSFFNWNYLTTPQFVGLTNFKTLLFHDPQFWKYVGNTVYLMGGIPINIGLSLVLAILLDKTGLKGKKFFRTIFFLPTAASGIAVYILWKWILNAQYGLFNIILSWFGIHGPDWLLDSNWSKPSLIIMGIWISMGGINFLLYLAALQNIPKHLYDAAEIDGAGSWKKFWNITWPLIRPTTFFIVIMSVIAGFQGGFAQAYVMTKGGPAGSTTTIDYYIFNNAYVNFKMGFASSISWTLFLIIFIFTLINWKLGKNGIEY
ncbi:sugar ABC transporter permease [candidate division KSB1 bacterium]|nr:sugar ABC transporter permease [candidate division KSB1 bacterium]